VKVGDLVKRRADQASAWTKHNPWMRDGWYTRHGVVLKIGFLANPSIRVLWTDGTIELLHPKFLEAVCK
tara:strand:- start:51 stop:257 length:207 start_codon:yes stop_codon:yes gene_type:complete